MMRFKPIEKLAIRTASLPEPSKKLLGRKITFTNPEDDILTVRYDGKEDRLGQGFKRTYICVKKRFLLWCWYEWVNVQYTLDICSHGRGDDNIHIVSTNIKDNT